ncbi:MAG TPA: hypothetical protein DD435_14585 [Cyanobacteria bacterium UBA8530]|nr:hypothetical protein [Cyanobacteria bacterium UBA8530]
MASGVAETVLHPERALASVAERYGKSKVDGAIAASNLGASVTGIGAITLTAGAFLAAPFTGGTSLALLPLAGSVGAVAGVIGLGSLGASILKNQSDIAGAKTPGELEKQSQELGNDFASAGMEVVAGVLGKGVEKGLERVPKNINPSSLQRTADAGADLVKKKLGLYDKSLPHGGTAVGNLSVEQLRKQGLKEVQEALEWSVQGERAIETLNLDRGSFERLENVGDRRLAFHGTRGDVKELVRQNGLKRSEIGDFGSGVYLAASAKTGLVYADDVTISRSLDSSVKPTVYTAEIATGKVMDLLSEKEAFLKWAKARFNPTDLKDPVNKLYANPSVPLNPLIDTSWNRFIPRYMSEMGFDSLLIRDAEGLGKDFWMVRDPGRIILRQEISFDPPSQRALLPETFVGSLNENVNPADPEKEK